MTKPSTVSLRGLTAHTISSSARVLLCALTAIFPTSCLICSAGAESRWANSLSRPISVRLAPSSSWMSRAMRTRSLSTICCISSVLQLALQLSPLDEADAPAHRQKEHSAAPILNHQVCQKYGATVSAMAVPASFQIPSLLQAVTRNR